MPNYYDNYGNYSRNDYHNNRRPRRKRTGAKTGVTKNGDTFISGWRATRQGLISCIGTMKKKTFKSKSKAGINWHSVPFKFTNKNTGQTWWMYGLVNETTKQVFFKDTNQTLKPSSPNGGYFGKHISNRRN